jgi:hypothetical protein
MRHRSSFVLLDALPMRGPLIGRVLGALLALPFGVYYGVILGTFGGSWAEAYLGRLGIPIGILFAFVVVTIAFVALGAFIGGAIGLLAMRMLGRI